MAREQDADEGSGRIRSRPLWLFVAVIVLAVLALGATYQLRRAEPLLKDAFDGPDALVTNEWASIHPTDPRAVLSPIWLVTSGSLFRREGHGWSGEPDTLAPGPTSQKATNSAVFRMVSRRDDITDAVIKTRFRVDGFGSAEESDWSGLHVFARYQDADELLAVSVCRRDGLVVVKKKILENGKGVYYELGRTSRPCTVGSWHTAELGVRNINGAVQVSVRIDGQDVLTARDSGQGGPPLARAGRVGFRGDNVPFELDDVVVNPA